MAFPMSANRTSLFLCNTFRFHTTFSSALTIFLWVEVTSHGTKVFSGFPCFYTKQQKDQHFQILPDLNTCIFDKKFTVALRQGTNTIKIPHGRNFTLKKNPSKTRPNKSFKRSEFNTFIDTFLAIHIQASVIYSTL